MFTNPRAAARQFLRRVPGVGPAYHRYVEPALSRYLSHESLPPFEGQDAAQPPGRFADLLFNHRGRVAFKWVHYCEIYEQLLGPFTQGMRLPDGTQRPVRFLEIGVFKGGSLEVWREFFGAEATIFGIDLDPTCLEVARDDLQVRIGSQADPAFLRTVVAEMGGVDVIVDDGSHQASHQRATFDVLFPLLSEGGIYIVEDTHTAYWFGYGGGLRRPGTVVQMAKGMVDGLHKWYFRTPVGRRARLAQAEIHSIQFFDSIVAFQKRHRPRPEVRRFGAGTTATD